MSEYDLTIQFTAEEAQKAAAAGKKLGIVKGTGDHGISNVVWIARTPLETNTIRWIGLYGLYFTPDLVRSGQVVTPKSTKYPMQVGVVYPLENGYFSPPEAKATPKNFSAENRMSDNLTMGLAQGVEVNGDAFDPCPTGASRVPIRSREEFMPSERVFIYLLDEAERGQVILANRKAGLEVNLTRTTQQKVHFNGEEGEFATGAL